MKYASIKKFLFFVFSVVMIGFYTVTAGSATALAAESKPVSRDEIEKELETEVDKNLSDLVNSDLENFFASISENIEGASGKSLVAYIKGILDGDNPLEVGDILALISESLLSELKGISVILITIVILAVLGGLSDSITSGFNKSGVASLIHWAVYGGIVVTLSIAVNSLIISARDMINGISTLINYTFPVFVTLLTALGGTGGVTMLAPMTIIIGDTVSAVIIGIVMPLFYATLVFTIVGNMSDNVKLGKLTKALKSVGGWVLGVTFGLITFIVAIQGMVGAGMDTIALKSAKFALSSYIPILGGYLSEGFDLVLASCVLIKNAFGLAVFVMLITIILAPMIKIIVMSLALKLVAGLIEPVSNPKVSELLYGTATNLNLLLSATGGMAFIVFIVLLLVIGAFNAGVV